MSRYAIIVAGGSGKRMKSAIPKQFLPLAGKPMLIHTLEVFYAFDPSIIVYLVLSKTDIHIWNTIAEQNNFLQQPMIIAGGSERFYSVKNAILQIPDTDNLVAVHDGVRPFVSQQILFDMFMIAAQKGNCIPVMDIKYSLRQKMDDGTSMGVNRNNYFEVQTPQVFPVNVLKSAYNQPYKHEFTDDASVVETLGIPIFYGEGDKQNIKITTSYDMQLAENIFKTNYTD